MTMHNAFLAAIIAEPAVLDALNTAAIAWAKAT
jgi:hypothetical protein